uniref:GST C-terminal domain-containing protein n=1 Tax=Pseudo-nitzschia australis TaxID=44445 RepID=A0A7S4AA87_9STRA|mmetsp:Transcript_2607/g.5658  ORF Transcript_2607/g.5658 Transcript_2607/m.5658 type:complete len:153 (-) Transcript_2607:1552-2010(-)
MRLFSELCGASSFSYWNILRAKGDEKFESAVQEFKQGLINTNTFLEKKGDPNGPFLFGNQFTLAECNAAPFVQRACNVLPAFTGKGEAETSECDSILVDPIKLCEEEGLTRLKSWISAVLTRPSVKHAELSREEMFQSVSKMLQRFEEMENK